MSTFGYMITTPCRHGHRPEHYGEPNCKHATDQYYDIVETHDGRETILAEGVRLEAAKRIVEALAREHWYQNEYIDHAAAAECEL